MNSPNRELVIVGCQSGDEGKGKFTDIFSEKTDFVVRYQGGPNTGHTVNVSGKKIRFVQLPSGLLHGCHGVLGNGCIIDPIALREEIQNFSLQSEKAWKLSISQSAHVVFPYHRVVDQAMERWRGDRWAVSAETGFSTGLGQLGSTNRGVGPCREDKVARIGLRMGDLTDAYVLKNKIPRLMKLKRSLVEAISGAPLESLPFYCADDWNEQRVLESYLDAGLYFKDWVGDVSALLAEARKNRAHILHEGAQSVGLDLEHGTYPFCSSGYSAAHGVTVGTGTPLNTPFEVYGVIKAYMSQSGGGPLPTEMETNTNDYVVERGYEFGTVTGRRRRVGWLDLPFIRRAVRVDGIQYLCVSSLDVLAGLDEIKIATSYLIDGKTHNALPTRLADMAKIEPRYCTVPGWPDTDWRRVAREGYRALPAPAQHFLQVIESELEVRVVAIGVGPDRQDTVLLRRPEF